MFGLEIKVLNFRILEPGQVQAPALCTKNSAVQPGNSGFFSICRSGHFRSGTLAYGNIKAVNRLSISGLARYFRHDIHAADACRYPKTSLGIAIFHAHHRSTAADPLLFALSNFGRQYQNHFQFAAGNNPRVGIKKNSAGTQISGHAGSGSIHARGRDGNRDPHRKTLP